MKNKSLVKIINPKANNYFTFNPERIPSPEVQAELYTWCKIAKIPVFLEYRHSPDCKFDMVVVVNGLVILIIEIKNYVTEGFRIKTGNLQFQKYKKHGVPVLIVGNYNAIPDAFLIVKKHFLRASGKVTKAKSDNALYEKMLKRFENKKLRLCRTL